MAAINIIKLSELKEAKRTDADYYQAEFQAIKRKLKKIKSVPLRSLIFYIKHPAEIKRVYEKKGIPFILAQNIIRDYWILQFIEERYISEEDSHKIPQNKLEVGDVIVTRTGANYGDASVYLGDPYPVFASSHMIIIRSYNISGEYLATYFNTYFGRKLIKRGWYGSSQPEISPGYLKSILVPRLSIENIVTNMVKESHKMQNKSKLLYTQAENMLLEQLGLKDFKPKYELSFTSNLSKAFIIYRVDAEYFQPAYEEILKIVEQKFSMLSLKKIFDFKRGVFIPTKYYTEYRTRRPFIRIKELSGSVGIDESKIIFINDEYQEDKFNELKEDDLVIAIIGDTIGKTNKIHKKLASGFCSNNMVRLRIKSEWTNKIIPEFAEILFQSLIIQIQIEQKKAQTGQPKINNYEIKTIKIPIIPFEIQQKISSLVKQSNVARLKAKELLEEAKSKIETEIEEKIK